MILLLFLVSCRSSDVVWEMKPKKKSRWKTLSTKEAEMLESSFKTYTESAPVDHAIVELENNFQVTPEILHIKFLLIWCSKQTDTIWTISKNYFL